MHCGFCSITYLVKTVSVDNTNEWVPLPSIDSFLWMKKPAHNYMKSILYLHVLSNDHIAVIYRDDHYFYQIFCTFVGDHTLEY